MMSDISNPQLTAPRPALQHVVVRYDPDDVHPRIAELYQRERAAHDRGEHEHIDFIPNTSR